MNILSKSKSLLSNFKLISIKSFYNHSFSLSYLPQSFFSKLPQKNCTHNKEDFYSLLSISKKNEPFILSTLLKYPDHNYICFLLQMVFELNFASSEFLEDLIPEFLRLEIKDPIILMNLYRGLPKAEPQLLQQVIDHIQMNIIKIMPRFKESNLLELKELTKLLPDPSRNEILLKIDNFLNVSSNEKIELYLKALELNELILTEKNVWEFIKIDQNNKEFRLLNKETNQEIILCGCDPYPCENLDHVLSVIEAEKNQINLLMVQDIPILDKSPDSFEEKEQIERKSSKSLVEYFKKKEFKDEMDGKLLEIYTKSFLNNEYFVMDSKEKKIYQKMNYLLFIPSELGSTVVRFVLNANSEKNCKVVLVDYPTIFQIASFNKNRSLEQCQDLMHICNFVNLLEKTHFSQVSYLMGCYKCNPKENDLKNLYKLPKDYISILSGGDILYPINERLEYLSRKIYKSIKKHSDTKKILVLVGRAYVEGVLKNLFLYSQQSRLGSLEPFSEISQLKKSLEIFKEVDKNSQILEKTVILEILHAVFCMDMTNLKNEDPKVNKPLQRYMDYFSHYSEMFSFQALADPSEQEQFIVESDSETEENDDENDNDDIEIMEENDDKILICPSHTMVYGGPSKEPLIKKFYLNPEFKKHFGGTNEEIEEMLGVYQSITEKTKRKDEGLVDNGDGRIKMKRRDERRKKKKKPEDE